jgi:excisionase family DNA binding protein
MPEVTAATKPDHAESVNEPPMLESIKETCRLTGLGRTKIYELFDSGELTRVKIGRRALVERSGIKRLIAAHRVV